MTMMFVSLLSFFYKISDATVGGIYLTVLKTAFAVGPYTTLCTVIQNKVVTGAVCVSVCLSIE